MPLNKTIQTITPKDMKIHFLAGLKNHSLKQIAIAARSKPFRELVDYLENELDYQT